MQLADLNEQQFKWVILTGDPDDISSECWEQILFIIKTKSLLLITRTGKINGWIDSRFKVHLSEKKSNGKQLGYDHNDYSKQWILRKDIEIQGLQVNTDLNKLVFVADTCIAASAREAEGKILFLSFHPSVARDLEPAFTSLLKQLLIKENSNPVAWFNWENTLILRMDDPGSAQQVHDDSFHNTKLSEQEWEIIGEELSKRHARISLGYVPAWVDDGVESRGQLEINGLAVPRLNGNIYPSPLVKYIKTPKDESPRIFDYQAEFQGIQKLRNKGLAEVELHGYTHMHPDRESWGRAGDKYESKSWYREFSRQCTNYIASRPEEVHPLDAGIEAFREIFQTKPSTLICPGDKFTKDVLKRTLRAGLNLVSSYYLGMRIGHQLCWNHYVCTSYLDKADPYLFDQEIPVVGYFHDFDLSIHGPSWFSKNLDDWEAAGAKYFMDLGEVAHIFAHTISIDGSSDQYQVKLNSEYDLPLIRPVRVGIHFPGNNVISERLIYPK